MIELGMNANEMIALAEELSLSYNEKGFSSADYDSRGSWRNVRLKDQYAFKSVQNMNDPDCVLEWDTYIFIHERMRNFLAKPLYVSRNGRTVVMDRLDTSIACYESKEFCDSFHDALKECGYTFTVGDIKSANLGKRQDGTIVLLDYGNIGYDLELGEKTRDNYEREKLMLALASTATV